MPYTGNEKTEEGPGQTWYVIYETEHKYRGGVTHERTNSREVYIPGWDPKWNLSNRMRTNRQGNTVRGISVSYKTTISGSEAKRNGTEYSLPNREVEITKIIKMPKGCKNIRVRKKEKKKNQEGGVWGNIR